MVLAAEHGMRNARRAPGESRFVVPPVDRRRALRRARIHSFLVRILRVLCPVAIVACFGLYFIHADLSFSVGKLQGSLESLKVSTRDLKMINPNLEGATEDGGRYKVNAESATQDFSNTDILTLKTIKARLTNKDESWTALTARDGVYQTKQELLRLEGDIVVEGSDGTTAHLEVADVNLQSQSVLTDRPVRIRMTNGNLTARSANLQSKNRKAAFAGNVRVHLIPENKPPKDDNGNQSPSPVSAAATPGTLTRPGFGASQGGPIDIQAARLDIDDAAKLAKFAGGTTATQDGNVMTSQLLDIAYSGNATPGASADRKENSNVEVQKLAAIGDFRLRTPEGRLVTGSRGDFDVISEIAVVQAPVRLEDAGNLIEGDLLTADMKAQTVEVSSRSRVNALFQPPASDSQAAKKQTEAPQVSGPGGFASGFISQQNSAEPVAISSKSLKVFDARQLATFSGNVKARRGTDHLTSNRLDVSYSSSDAAGAGAQAGSQAGSIRQIRAMGKVLISSVGAPGPNGEPAEQRTVSGDEALFDTLADTVVVTGRVIVTQGESVIKGEKLVIDVKSGRSTLETGGRNAVEGTQAGCPPGRICAVFMPRQSDNVPSVRRTTQPKRQSGQDRTGSGQTGAGRTREPEISGWSTSTQ